MNVPDFAAGVAAAAAATGAGAGVAGGCCAHVCNVSMVAAMPNGEAARRIERGRTLSMAIFSPAATIDAA